MLSLLLELSQQDAHCPSTSWPLAPVHLMDITLLTENFKFKPYSGSKAGAVVMWC